MWNNENMSHDKLRSVDVEIFPQKVGCCLCPLFFGNISPSISPPATGLHLGSLLVVHPLWPRPPPLFDLLRRRSGKVDDVPQVVRGQSAVFDVGRAVVVIVVVVPVGKISPLV